MFFTQLFRTKPIDRIYKDASSDAVETATHSAHGLKKTLTVVDLTSLGIAAVIGAGIFATVGTAAANGGPAVSLLFIFTAVACGFSALCYAQFASTIPVAGSAYTYAYASLGEFMAWIIGWDLVMEYAIGNIAVAISWSDYFTAFMSQYGLHVPDYMTMDFVSAKRGFAVVSEFLMQGGTLAEAASGAVTANTMDAYNAYVNAPTVFGVPLVGDIPAVLITILATVIVYIGIRESKKVANLMVLLKILVVILVIVVGAFYVEPANWKPFAPEGLSGVLKGISGVFFAYIGFDAISTTAEECKDAKRDLPRAMMYALLICTVLYVLIALVLTGMVPYTSLNVGDPLAYVFGPEAANIPWVSAIVAGSAIVALFSVLLVFQIGQPRIWMVMGRDGLLPSVFARIHPIYKTPSFSTILTGVVIAVPCLFMNLTEVTDLTSIGTLFAFLIVCAGTFFMDASKAKFQVPYINGRWVFPVVYAALLYYLASTKSSFALTDAEGSIIGEMIIFYIYICAMTTLTVLAVIHQLSLIPLLGVTTCSYLMTELGVTNWLRFGIWLLVGLAVYFLYGMKNSVLNEQSK
jgi:basic amino acid/polyamine antiporter, APA family